MPASGRRYTIALNNVAISSAQDLFAIYAGTSKIFAVHKISMGQVTGTGVVNARMRLLRLPATVTAGTGGATALVSSTTPGAAAATVTARTNDTTQASTSGTAIILEPAVWNTIIGFEWRPSSLNNPPLIDRSEAFVLSLDQTLSAYVTNGVVEIEELP